MENPISYWYTHALYCSTLSGNIRTVWVKISRHNAPYIYVQGGAVVLIASWLGQGGGYMSIVASAKVLFARVYASTREINMR